MPRSKAHKGKHRWIHHRLLSWTKFDRVRQPIEKWQLVRQLANGPNKPPCIVDHHRADANNSNDSRWFLCWSVLIIGGGDRILRRFLHAPNRVYFFFAAPALMNLFRKKEQTFKIFAYWQLAIGSTDSVGCRMISDLEPVRPGVSARSTPELPATLTECHRPPRCSFCPAACTCRPPSRPPRCPPAWSPRSSSPPPWRTSSRSPCESLRPPAVPWCISGMDEKLKWVKVSWSQLKRVEVS